jgi:CHAT domain-containing protein/tetratricopeptide (TPR) repeat protein
MRARTRLRVIGFIVQLSAAIALTMVLAAQGTDRVDSLEAVVASLVADGRSADPKTLDLARTAVAQRAGGPPLARAAALHLLGDVLAARGEFAAALRQHEEGLALRTRAGGPSSDVVADSHERMVLPLIRVERLADALGFARAACRIRRQGGPGLPLARCLFLLGSAERYSGNYAAAIAALDDAEQSAGAPLAEHPLRAALLQVRGDVRMLQGNAVAARQAWGDALRSAEATLRPDHPQLALYLRMSAFGESAVGDFGRARVLRDRAATVAASLPPCDPEVTSLLNDRALGLAWDGDLPGARRLYERQIAADERCRGPRHSLTAEGVHNLANLLAEMGDLVEAERLHRRAVEIWRAALGATHPYVARGLDALAQVVERRGRRLEARQLYERSLEIRRRAQGDASGDVAWTLTNLARVLDVTGQPGRALELLDEAIGIYRTAGAGDEPDHLARALELRGTVAAGRGEADQALQDLAAALSERTRIFGPEHPLVADTQAAVAHVGLAAGRRESALAAALTAEAIGRAHVRSVVRYLPERQALAYAARRPAALALAIALVSPGASGEAARVLDAVVRSRGLILDELAERSRFARDSSTASAADRAAHAERQRYANLVVRSLQEAVSPGVLDEARRRAETAERALAERNAEGRVEAVHRDVGLAQVRAALPPESALVSFVRHDRPAPARGAGAAAYAAFIVKAGTGEPIYVPLGDASDVDARITRWRAEAGGQSMASGPAAAWERRYRAVGTRLRAALWDPLAAHLSDASRVFVVPDGSINLVSLAALPVGDADYLIESAPILHYLTTERDLLQSRDATPVTGLLAVGGAAFGPGAPGAAAAAVRGAGCVSNQMYFQSLPGARAEVDDIAAIWPRDGARTATVLTGPAADEAAVKTAVAGRRVVHFATHGFFLDTRCEPAPAGVRAVGGLTAPSVSSPPSSTPSAPPPSTTRPVRPPAGVRVDNPLLLSGLALAGANRRATSRAGRDDGILTAEEIAGLDLHGTEWAVLSACDTGLGEIRAGEGVFGLRRAFQIAGARTVIMSLWSVDDRATRAWMRALYAGRFQRRLDTASAVRDATLSALRERRAKRLGTHPFYWAAFVAAGDWR